MMDSTQKAVVYVSLIGLLALPFLNLFGAFFKFVEVAQEMILILYLKLHVNKYR